MAVNNTYLGSPENPRTAAIVCYITVIGWLIAYYALYKNEKSSLSAFHLRQTLLLHIIGFILDILAFLSLWSLFPASVITVLGIILFILWVWGLKNALNEEEKPVPVVGKMAQRLFKKL